jgi:hypothetical protein
MDDAQTQTLSPPTHAFGCVIDTRMHIMPLSDAQSVNNQTQNLCLGSTKTCLVDWAIGQSIILVDMCQSPQGPTAPHSNHPIDFHFSNFLKQQSLKG